MKKFAFLCVAVALLFAGCKKDPLDKLENNQASLNGEIVELAAHLAVRPATDGDVGAHYVDFIPADNSFTIRFDIGTPLVGKTIDLANPTPVVGSNQFSYMYCGPDGDFIAQLEGNPLFGSLNGTEYDGKSCFASGTFTATHNTSDGFLLEMSGEFLDGKTFALKGYVPENEVEYWNAN